MSTRSPSAELRMDPEQLYREEVFTDRRIGTLRKLIPVDPEGKDDPGRQVLYSGEAQVLTPMGALPINFEIEADSLRQAVERFADLAAAAFERTVQELQEMRRDAASSIVLPERGAPGGMGGGPGMGGGIQMP